MSFSSPLISIDEYWGFDRIGVKSLMGSGSIDTRTSDQDRDRGKHYWNQ